MEILISYYQPDKQTFFEKFNKAWLNKYFTVEPIDKYVLEHPEEAILRDGGEILFAAYDGVIVGTVALKRVSEEVMELTKMAVDESYHGLGIGKALCAHAIEKARELGVKKLVLYSQSILQSALAIYRKYGFYNVPVDNPKYKRADVMMELVL
ncbi:MULTISPECIES: GNAT family N-acetyltransferase [Olivibacter]|jgi:ribosomal protein S18 acetylase RimI-like enzyme|uniref:GCN5-related N-acetyltransferase n=2 Tax=Sphingobacteriaceae TaxID=84566 RepID=F4C1B9_SPHS2|nr:MULTISPECIES: GNAT family N-acetyltransferase [Olivibacter]MDM8177628.1 GNAT family N-acetyltransferase [Olivibacter sp. 47]QEL00071.1 GNAT family N-acetyltransferase [Olivibacter sp. LS-1]